VSDEADPQPRAGAETETETERGRGEPDEPTDAALELLWSRVLDDWGEPKTHHALLEYALTAQKLPEVAGRYRALRDDPDKGAEAKKRLDGVVLAATQLLMASATPREKTKTPVIVTLTAVVIFVALLTWALRAVYGLGR
jgi:hypothetical protein